MHEAIIDDLQAELFLRSGAGGSAQSTPTGSPVVPLAHVPSTGGGGLAAGPGDAQRDPWDEAARALDRPPLVLGTVSGAPPAGLTEILTRTAGMITQRLGLSGAACVYVCSYKGSRGAGGRMGGWVVVVRGGGGGGRWVVHRNDAARAAHPGHRVRGRLNT
jgi:hypothetical protein